MIEKPPPHKPSLVTPLLFAVVVGAVLVLLIVVITVGLLRDQIDVTAIASVLGTLISAIVVGALVRKPGGGE